jgi:hypothetical protein
MLSAGILDDAWLHKQRRLKIEVSKDFSRSRVCRRYSAIKNEAVGVWHRRDIRGLNKFLAHYIAIAFKSWRIIGRAAARRATSLKPATETGPVKMFDVLFGAVVSTGPPIGSAHEETRYQPDGHIVHTLEPPHAIKPL